MSIRIATPRAGKFLRLLERIKEEAEKAKRS